MNAEIVERADAKVLGTMARINPMEADYRALWDGQFDPHTAEVAAHAVEEGYYSVYYATEEEGKADYIAGQMVGDVADVSEGLTLRAVPGGTCARFDCKMAAIGQTWGAIYGQWLPASAYEQDETRPSLEYYPPGAMGPEADVAIFVPVKRK